MAGLFDAWQPSRAFPAGPGGDRQDLPRAARLPARDAAAAVPWDGGRRRRGGFPAALRDQGDAARRVRGLHTAFGVEDLRAYGFPVPTRYDAFMNEICWRSRRHQRVTLRYWPPRSTAWLAIAAASYAAFIALALWSPVRGGCRTSPNCLSVVGFRIDSDSHQSSAFPAQPHHARGAAAARVGGVVDKAVAIIVDAAVAACSEASVGLVQPGSAG